MYVSIWFVVHYRVCIVPLLLFLTVQIVIFVQLNLSLSCVSNKVLLLEVGHGYTRMSG